MENIDVRDLPEDQAQLLAAFVEFLKRRAQRPEPHPPAPREATEHPFAVWDLGVKGTVSREEIYDHL